MTIPILVAAMLVQPAANSTSAASTPLWTLAVSDEEGEYWLDQASVRKEGAVRRFRMRQKAREAGSRAVESVLVAYQLDCSRQTMAMESMEAFDSAGRTVATRTVPVDWLDKDPIYSGSLEEKVYLRICPAAERRKLADRPPPPVMMTVAAPPAPPVPPIMIAPPAPPPPPPPPPPGSYPTVRATPVVPLVTLFSADDYPAAALRNEEEGSVTYRMDIDKKGRIAACTVTSSSGSSSLDNATCRLVTARARFKPARNARGKKMSDVVYGRIVWRFPDDPPPPTASEGQ